MNDNSKFVSLGDYNSRDLSDLLSRTKKETYVDIEKQMPVSMTQPKNNVSFIPSNRSHMDDFTKSAGVKNGIINENEITKDNHTLVDNKLIKMEDVDYRTLASHMVDNLINPIKGTYEVGVNHAVAAASNASQALQTALSKTELKFDPETSLTKLNYQLADVGMETSYLVSDIVKRVTRQTSDIVENMVGVVPTIKQGMDKVISGEMSDSLRRTLNQEVKRDHSAIPTIPVFNSHNNTSYLIKDDTKNGQVNNRLNGSNTSKAYANEMIIDREITSAKEKGLYRPIDDHMGFIVPHQGKKDSSSLTTTILRNVLRKHETSHMGQASKINMQDASDRDILATRIVNDLKGYKVPETTVGTYPTKSSHHTSSINLARVPTKMIVENDNDNFKMTSAPNAVSNKTHTMVDSDNNNRSMQNTLPVYNGRSVSNFSTYSNTTTSSNTIPINFKLDQDGNRPLDVNGSSKRFLAERS